ncbi:sulfurtransferase complex subunit TusD [Shewanella marina]|uniref:sulfurtransferase complex subunit TusD n=1 Tax=Shewanella marina TaxID=487319 RepID=UPI000470F3D1|nr:sulfurtransferase complex subunit TusD [Shewanella marina]
MHTFIIQVNGPAYGSQSSYHAYRFTQACLSAGHQVEKVFFYQDGVLNANMLHAPASDEFDLAKAWRELATTHQIPLINCVAAAMRRGVLAETDAKELNLSQWNSEAPFSNAGLGELVTGIETAQRLVSF